MNAVSISNSRALSNRQQAVAHQILQRLVLPTTNCALLTTASPERKSLENYIADKFKRSHQASITEFMPQHFTIQCENSIAAVAGIRKAKDHNLFVEHYLDRPIEQELSQTHMRPIDRNGIIEIGNLVSTKAGASQLIFILLTAVLYEANYRWAIFTATEQVEQLLKTCPFRLYSLGKADASRLGKNAAQWGNYYENNPRLLTGDLADAMKQAQLNPETSTLLSTYKSTIQTLAKELRLTH
jgi:hypothetical protein